MYLFSCLCFSMCVCNSIPLEVRGQPWVFVIMDLAVFSFESFWCAYVMNVHVCGYICTYVQLDVEVRGWCQVFPSTILHPRYFESGSHLNPELTDATACFKNIMVLPPWCWIQAAYQANSGFRWVLGLWTTVVLLAWQVLYPLRHIPSPPLFFFERGFHCTTKADLKLLGSRDNSFVSFCNSWGL